MANTRTPRADVQAKIISRKVNRAVDTLRRFLESAMKYVQTLMAMFYCFCAKVFALNQIQKEKNSHESTKKDSPSLSSSSSSASPLASSTAEAAENSKARSDAQAQGFSNEQTTFIPKSIASSSMAVAAVPAVAVTISALGDAAVLDAAVTVAQVGALAIFLTYGMDALTGFFGAINARPSVEQEEGAAKEDVAQQTEGAPQ
ncbi:hypothetical protein GUITHDRAFT_110736 [Guillardia theta CCMP2712]|uniref:Uncharacterized protein n=1 Tax=Guillardia theta (strain CCMP2712) TaxID=905079 RepID=L1J4A3_GUITC|nr:hypothetical protein GUITHDRAFT_110736 [Guillardia theta CCMP2712]EKX43321.1 hypothetical protein GUITHDRAFT_110736 [Guillardia theta CCMP2712]|eukprot:XP_005830301.1 hypothetical protein GUITHDRAFT_110736 [Guillardia theta CCMP2712]